MVIAFLAHRRKAVRNSSIESTRRFPFSQREVTSVFRQFPSRTAYRAILRARFVQHGIVLLM